MYKRISGVLHLLVLVVLLGTCGSSAYLIKHEPDVMPVETIAPTPVVSASPTSNTGSEVGWSLLQPGLERRVISIHNNQNQQVESLHIWRLDQNYFRMDVAYNETPRSLENWQIETKALLVMNAGYYSIENKSYFPVGLTIIDGKAFGQSFIGYGGMLAINATGAELRWLVQKPYNPFEALKAALQSFPILVKPGGELGFGADRENNVSARRTVIGQDRDGRILFMVAPQGYFTLHQLSVYLTKSDLNLDIAVNLDGGGSTGILLANPREIISPDRPLPFVILVYAR
jgi:uncharacterized protein YigE (DUF2233 family)